ncbi:DUF1642 domain-containing protein [Lacticaseibacillus paracasei]|uniref:DUF1642 domain-containing protein n=1 Tax=Lacticaseibacillus paracasei TaxID=1597 RepID=UPI00235FBE94|nr:DUF1642 domain-containing protein [Lacticaseibacillus paracasei]
MSKRKLYAIKNGEGKYLTIERTAPWWDSQVGTAVRSAAVALAWAGKHGGHVVMLVEEPKKVVLTKEQAKIVEDARDEHHPASVLRFSGKDDEELLLNAYVNGWTVEKPKRYVLPMPGTNYHNYQMRGNAQYYAVKITGSWRPDGIALGTDDAVKHGYTVTQSDIDAAPAWVKAIKPFEVTDNGIR